MVKTSSPTLWHRFIAGMRAAIGNRPINFGYDAVTDTGRRRSTITRIKHEDQELKERHRVILSATTADMARNFSVARWAIAKHLDYVTAFRFQATTGDRAYDREVEMIVNAYRRRHLFDVAARHPMRRAVRLAEAHRCRDGDTFWLKLAPASDRSRGRVQMIEGDKIRTPDFKDAATISNFKNQTWSNGVRLGPTGAAQAYGVHNRDSVGNYSLNRVVTARNMMHHAWWDRVDQSRGISPIASALNSFRDVYETAEYAKAKMKVSQLFGLVTYRDAEFPLGGAGTADPTSDEDDDGTDESKYEVDFGRGPFQLDLDPGDKAEFLESKTPSAETVNFIKLIIHIALRSLDIPFSFFDESFTNFYGSRGGLIQYLKSCKTKIEDITDFMDEWTRWRLGLLVADGLLELPSGQDFSFLKWSWIPDGVPWWDKSKEAKGCAAAVAGGFDNPQRICHESNTDFYDNVDAIADAHAYAASKGVVLQYATAPAAAADEPDFEVNTEGDSDDAD